MAIEAITDPGDPRLDDYRDLRDAELRRERGLFAVEGRWLAERLLAARRFQARSILVTPDALAALRAPIAAAGVDAYVAGHDVVREVVGFKFHRGVIALGVRPAPDSVESVARGARTIVALEDVRDPENVGGVMRNAHAFGVDAVILEAHCADALGRKAIRVSAGAVFALPFARTSEWPAALASIHAMGFTLVALTPDRGAPDLATALHDVDGRVACLIGSEESGLRGPTRRLADVEARIPMAPGVDSLNAAVAAGIALSMRYSRP